MLSGKRILITGSNGGMGNSISEILLENNAELVLLYNKNHDQLDNLISKTKSKIQIYQVDLCDSIQLDLTLKKILDSDKIDIFIHSVTLPITYKPIKDLSWNEYQKHIDLQTKSFLQITKSLIPKMKKNNGKIISILTSYTMGTPPNSMSNYITAKYALLGLSKSLAVELGPLGITVNCVSPSMTPTPLISNIALKAKEIVEHQTPLKRLASPTDTASVVLFLCSKLSDFVNGENLLVTGGQIMH